MNFLEAKVSNDYLEWNKSIFLRKTSFFPRDRNNPSIKTN